MPVQFSINCQLDYTVLGPTEFIFNVQAVESAHQAILGESLNISGATTVDEFVHADSGNRFVRASAEAGRLGLRYSAQLSVEHFCAAPGDIRELEVAELPAEVLPYVLPSRYCESDRFVDLAQAKFGTLHKGYGRVEAVCDWVNSQVRFTSGTTTSCTTASDVLEQGTGVCRDFAHLTITLLRALNIPARFVTGYDYGVDPVWGPTDFHAYVEAFLGDRWWIFDSTRLCPRNGLVRIGVGRDAVDAAFATIFGPIRFEGMTLAIEPDALVSDDRTSAMSTAAPIPRPGRTQPRLAA